MVSPGPKEGLWVGELDVGTSVGTLEGAEVVGVLVGRCVGSRDGDLDVANLRRCISFFIIGRYVSYSLSTVEWDSVTFGVGGNVVLASDDGVFCLRRFAGDINVGIFSSNPSLRFIFCLCSGVLMRSNNVW